MVISSPTPSTLHLAPNCKVLLLEETRMESAAYHRIPVV